MAHYPTDLVRIWAEKRQERLLEPVTKQVLVDELLRAYVPSPSS
jgi:hypothetical protein